MASDRRRTSAAQGSEGRRGEGRRRKGKEERRGEGKRGGRGEESGEGKETKGGGRRDKRAPAGAHTYLKATAKGGKIEGERVNPSFPVL